MKIAAKVDRADQAYWKNIIKPMIDSSPNVESVGEIGDRDKGDFLGNADALLFLIDWPEPFGLVMIEAMACGTPVIAFRRGSAPEIIDEGVSGFLVDDVLQATAAARRVAELDRRLAARRCGARGNIPAGAPSPCGRDVVKPPGIAFQKFSKLDRHRPRIRVNHVPTLQVTDQTAMKIIQAVIKDDGNPRPFSIVAKNFSTSHGRDNFASFLIDDEINSHAYLQQRLRTPRLTGNRRGA